ncbi:MAG TPA: hypothetical protein PLG92_01500 [Piscinibacter sp.]|nr:MAG: hypothetical protein E6Q93_12990 [Burkholderiaceae bacterium]HNK17026.1 hypothetical protein [Piscinibacter sp.]
MNAIAFPTLDDVSSEARPRLEGPLKHLGFVPNLLVGLSTSPAKLASHVELSRHFAKLDLTGIEMQVVLIVARLENACASCVAAHSTFSAAPSCPMRSWMRWRRSCAG